MVVDKLDADKHLHYCAGPRWVVEMMIEFRAAYVNHLYAASVSFTGRLRPPMTKVSREDDVKAPARKPLVAFRISH
jgi:hypothetical protein